jgi:hypothetical protein
MRSDHSLKSMVAFESCSRVVVSSVDFVGPSLASDLEGFRFFGSCCFFSFDFSPLPLLTFCHPSASLFVESCILGQFIWKWPCS